MHGETTIHLSDLSGSTENSSSTPMSEDTTVSTQKTDLEKVLEIVDGYMFEETEFGNLREAKLHLFDKLTSEAAPAYLRAVAAFPSATQTALIRMAKTGMTSIEIKKATGLSAVFVQNSIGMAGRLGILERSEKAKKQLARYNVIKDKLRARHKESIEDRRARKALSDAMPKAAKLPNGAARHGIPDKMIERLTQKGLLSRVTGIEEKPVVKAPDHVVFVAPTTPVPTVTVIAPSVTSSTTSVTLNLTAEQMAKLFNMLNNG